jgi:hypothetical protein
VRRSIRVLVAAATLSSAVAIMSPIAHADAGLKLRPGSFGPNTEGAWKSKQGRPDNKGNARFALFLQKNTLTATVAAAYAVVDNIEGTPVSELTGLSWEHRTDGHCGAGAPRWNLVVQDPSGLTHTVFLGCNAATHSPTSDPLNWMKDSYDTLAIQAALAAAGVAPGATITQLYVLFDEGTDTAPGGLITAAGFVYLDNITVELNGTPKVFTSPGDNGS